MAGSTSFLGVSAGGLAEESTSAQARAFWKQASEAVQDFGGKAVAQLPKQGLFASRFEEVTPMVEAARQLSTAFGGYRPALAATVIRQPKVSVGRLVAAMLFPSLVGSLGASWEVYEKLYETLYGQSFTDLLRTARELGARPSPEGLVLVGATPELRAYLGRHLQTSAPVRVAGVSAPVDVVSLGGGPADTRGDETKGAGDARGLGATRRGVGGGGSRGGDGGGRGRSGSGSGPPSPPPRDRFLEGLFVDRVRLGDVVTLQARIALQASKSGRSAKLRAFESSTIGLTLHSPGFDLVEDTERLGDSRMIDIPREGDSDWVRFRLRAVKEGDHTVILTGYARGGYVGELRMPVSIEKETETGAGRTYRDAVEDRPEASGELTLQIKKTRELYTFQLIEGDDFGTPEDLPLRTTPTAAIEALIEKLNLFARGGHGHSGDYVRNALADQGFQLWDAFVPQPLKTVLWQRLPNIKCLYIRSNDDLVPWELLHPTDPENPEKSRGFLAEQFPIAHRPFGPPRTDRLRISDACYVLPHGAPQSAAEEIGAVREQIERSGGTTMGTFAAYRELNDVLEAGAFGLLHFACHNQNLGGDASTIQIALDGGPLEPSRLSRMKGRFAERAPLIFLNACRTTAERPLYVKPFGWATHFMHAGAGAFVGTSWEVRDTSAQRFAKTFYDQALGSGNGGLTLGDAFHAARTAIAKDTSDPTWLAYTLYGNLRATISTEASS